MHIYLQPDDDLWISNLRSKQVHANRGLFLVAQKYDYQCMYQNVHACVSVVSMHGVVHDMCQRMQASMNV